MQLESPFVQYLSQSGLCFRLSYWEELIENQELLGRNDPVTVYCEREGTRFRKYAHRDGLVFVDPHHVSHAEVFPLHCAEA